jgi:crotonobetainyl-CoA:carnitine CoA-transferase CaiB-like acyl-CoA transferase
MSSGPLDGIRVLDLSRLLAGPLCTMLLADMGADVVKVEPLVGEDTRSLAPPYVGDESAYFLAVNRNKRGLAIDLEHPEGRQLALELAARADVLVENFRPGAVSRLGLDYATVRAANPRIVYVAISAFGEEGPYRDRPAIDLVFQGLGGTMSITGEEGGPPVKPGTPLADLTAGMLAAYGTLVALFERARSGQGQKVELALFDAIITHQLTALSYYLATGENHPRLGTASPFLVPAQTFGTADRPINLAIVNDRFWRRFCEAIERPDLAEDPRFRTNPLRIENRRELVPILERIFATRSAAHWLELLGRAGIPCSPIQTHAELCADPHVRARGMLVEMEHPTAGRIQVTGIPLRLSATPGSIRRPPPRLGEHTEEVLREIGVPESRIRSLRAEGVIR